MQSLTVPLSRGKPICGQRLSTAYTWPLCQKSATTCCWASTVKRPSACNAARVATRTHWVSVGGWACVVRLILCLLLRLRQQATAIARQAGMMQAVARRIHGVCQEHASYIFQRKNFRKYYTSGD